MQELVSRPENKAGLKRWSERWKGLRREEMMTHTTDPLTTPPTAPTTALPKGESIGNAILLTLSSCRELIERE